MNENYLKHITVVVINVCATILSFNNPELLNEAMIIYATTMGYVFKNGVHKESK